MMDILKQHDEARELRAKDTWFDTKIPEINYPDTSPAEKHCSILTYVKEELWPVVRGYFLRG